MWTARRVLPLPFAPQNVVVLPPVTENEVFSSTPGIENSLGMLVWSLDIRRAPSELEQGEAVFAANPVGPVEPVG